MWRLTDEERELREHIRSVVLEQVRPRVREMDENCDYPHDVHETLAREGLMGLALPSEYGGRESSEVSWCAYVEELAKISGTVSLMAAYVKLVALPILIALSEEQKQEFLPPLVSGERYGSYALTEPAVGSDPAALQTRAERHGDTWVLNGEKRFIGNAGHADTYVVFARTGDAGATGARRQRLPQGLPGRAHDARREGAADLRGRQRDPAARHRAPDGQGAGGAGAGMARADARRGRGDLGVARGRFAS
jgi:acyl-CoA dehydrogenase